MTLLRTLAIGLATAALVTVHLAPAAGAPVTFQFGGTVSGLQIDINSPGPPPPWDAIATGDAWSIAVTFETTTPDTSPIGNVGTYSGAITSFTFDTGDEFVSPAPEDSSISVVDDVGPVGDRYTVSITTPDLAWSVDLQDNSATAFASADLPGDLLDLAAFASFRELRFGAASGEWTWTGDVTVHDVIPQPDIAISCPADAELPCGAPSDPSTTGTATGSSNTVVTFADAISPSLCAISLNIERTWTATDVEGNAVSCVQTIAFIDGVAPAVSCPPDVEVACGESADPASTGVATAMDIEDPAPVVTFEDEETPSECPGSPSLERTWTATDASENAASCVQTITFVDCGLSLFPDFLAFLASLDPTPLFGDMTGPLRIINERRKQELITHALAAGALLESGDRAGALDELSWIRERMDGGLLGLLDWVKGPAAAAGRAQIDEIAGKIEDCGA